MCADGNFIGHFGEGKLKSPCDVDFVPNGDILVDDSSNRRIVVFSPDGSSILRSFKGTFEFSTVITCHAGLLYVLDQNSDRLEVFC